MSPRDFVWSIWPLGGRQAALDTRDRSGREHTFDRVLAVRTFRRPDHDAADMHWVRQNRPDTKSD